MKRFALFAGIALLLVSCSSPMPAPQATYTPLPTYTPYPTFTPLAATSPLPTLRASTAPAPKTTPLPQTTAPAQTCVAWKDAAVHMGETTCVRGVVSSTNKSGSTFFIDFDNTRASFYGVSFTLTWDNLKGKCIEIYGKISPYRDRPQIVIEEQEQVRECR